MRGVDSFLHKRVHDGEKILLYIVAAFVCFFYLCYFVGSIAKQQFSSRENERSRLFSTKDDVHD